MILAVLPLPPSSLSSPSATTSDSSDTASTESSQNKILIFVWALEQDPQFAGTGSARRGKKGVEIVPLAEIRGLSLEGEQEEAESSHLRARLDHVHEIEDGSRTRTSIEEQDVYVPWALQPTPIPRVRKPPQTAGSNGAKVMRPRKTREEWEAAGASTSSTSSSEVTSTGPAKVHDSRIDDIPAGDEKEAEERPNFNRYYHLFRHLELSDLVRQAADALDFDYIDSTTSRVNAPAKNEIRKELRIQVELIREVWERENWVVEIGVRWC